MRHFPIDFAPRWEERDHMMEPPVISEQGQALVMWIGVALSGTFVAIRTHAQYRNSRRLFINDYCIFFALVCHIATAIVYQIAISPMYDVLSVSAGLKPMGPTFMEQGAIFLKLQYAADILLWTTLCDISGDVCVMLIPFPLLYKLKIDNRKRWILIGLFSLPDNPGIICMPPSG
ncbi:hypothetical protein N7486_011366 [Penicillium sp. IBT 16267x]|nr:hypothetical protein N7486_011366 [Penicillium sp. IBT 16267x]